MKKWNMMLLALALLICPAAGLAQDLPDFLSAVYTGVGEGLEQGAMQAMAAMDQELTLEMIPSSERVEENGSVLLTVKAGNPRPQEAAVKITLDLPMRLSVMPDTAWEAVLPEAVYDPQTGEFVPSETVFVREIALQPGGKSEDVEIIAEMSMGPRFYRTKTELALCVPDVHAKAKLTGAQNGRVQPGKAFAYQVEIVNAGTASENTEVELLLPDGMAAVEPLPSGFEQAEDGIRGRVTAEAAADAPSSVVLTFPMEVSASVLEGDDDASRLMNSTLHVGDERVALPRVQVCGPKISAALLSEKETLEAGESGKLSIVVVNSGLAAADVRLSCVLPQGLTLQSEEEKEEKAAVLPPEDPSAPAGAAIPAVVAQEAVKTLENRTLVYDVHMDGARETKDGVITNTQIIEIPVKACAPQDNLPEMLLGATLAWSVDDANTQLGEAVALRVRRDTFLGIDKAEWNGLFWASVLLLAAVACLYAAARRDCKAEDFCCE